ncbi:MAG: serine/threonine protein kinase [Frankiales bacterium]|nr:serine/threonine protein kinase [Frankiales bacterium]
MRSRTRPALVALAALLVAAPLLTAPAAAEVPVALREVMFVGNNWAGTVTIVDARTHEVLKTGVDFIPDKEQELADIRTDPEALAFYLAIQQGPGEGHDQYVDDMFSTLDGRYVAVSRPSFADVVWIDVVKAIAGETDVIVHEEQMDGRRTDHMGLSPDGRRLLVSDSTAAQVIEYSMVDEALPSRGRTTLGQRLRTFPTGETPHESNYSADGERIFHASIGKVYTPGDATGVGPVTLGEVADALKGDRWFQIVRNADFSILQRWDMGNELEEAGYEDMSSAVRPMAIAPGERFLYFQVSFFHGLVEYDTQAPDANGTVDYSTGDIPEPRTGAVTRVIELPNRVPDVPREQYVNDSAHHGLSMDEAGTTLCVAGTMSDYVALVDRTTMKPTFFDESTTGHSYGKPYWTTEGLDDTCWISLSEADSVAVLDVKTRKELAYLPVGDHPQRVRYGLVPAASLRAAPVAAPPPAAPAPQAPPSTAGGQLPATGVATGAAAAAALLLGMGLLLRRRRAVPARSTGFSA